jgi:hypothetical protein
LIELVVFAALKDDQFRLQFLVTLEIQKYLIQLPVSSVVIEDLDGTGSSLTAHKQRIDAQSLYPERWLPCR